MVIIDGLKLMVKINISLILKVLIIFFNYQMISRYARLIYYVFSPLLP